MPKPGIYILKSVKNDRFYIGSTDNIERRLEQHSTGLVKATQWIRPLQLKIFIACESLRTARQYEYRLKRYHSRVILKKVIRDSCLPWEHQNTGV